MKSQHLAYVLSLCAGILLSSTAQTAGAQQPAPMSADTMKMADDGSASPSTQAFKEQDGGMMKNMMAAPYTGDADKDFVAHMIPHHEGAVGMAEVELKYGKDAEMKRLARNIIKAQKEEIAYMKKWQARHGGM